MAENKKLNFDNVDEPGMALTSPGTIAVFLISEPKFDSSKEKNTPFLGINFKELDNSGKPISQFNESFYTTEKAMPRIQHVVTKVTGAKLTGEITEEQMITKLSGKKIALKVGGRVGSNGNGYPRLAFGNFAATPDKMGELVFSAAEKIEVQAALDAIAASRSKTADSDGTPREGQSQPATTTADEDY